MTTAREQALESAKARFFDSARTVNPTPAQEYVCQVAVTEAAEVYEPILRDLATMLEEYDRTSITDPSLRRAMAQKRKQTLARTFDALGGYEG